MKKIISSLAIAGMLTFGISTITFAQEAEANDAQTEQVEAISDTSGDIADASVDQAVETMESAPADSETGFVAMLKKKFIEGDPFWMGTVLVCLIIGVALCIERIVYLNLSSINTNQFLSDVEDLLAKGKVDEAKELCRNTRGPIASIFYQGLSRVNEGVDSVEKTVVSYGGVQMGLLEKGIPWIALFIALSPMLGFMGTVVGMIMAFEKIVEDGQVSPITVAGGIQVALLTTVFGLIAAIILQIFYNYIISKIDGIVNEMENSSITLVDMLIKHKVGQA
ncbi:MAG: MotA/TolQ/ExbB proton channel family protein [Brumimicrobium sp.]|nr:MotA/TolQ/ExbB proton channel family protein [Brumimicrobium sp.]